MPRVIRWQSRVFFISFLFAPGKKKKISEGFRDILTVPECDAIPLPTLFIRMEELRQDYFPMVFSWVDQESEQSQKPGSWCLFYDKVSLGQEKWHTPQVLCFSNSPSSGLRSPSLTRWRPWNKQGKQQMPNILSHKLLKTHRLECTQACMFSLPHRPPIPIFPHINVDLVSHCPSCLKSLALR